MVRYISLKRVVSLTYLLLNLASQLHCKVKADVEVPDNPTDKTESVRLPNRKTFDTIINCQSIPVDTGERNREGTDTKLQ